MKELIKHLVNQNMQQIVNKSFLDCHCYGLHSIMLLESPEQTIRLFVADPSHELHYNFAFNDSMTVAFHPHHCNVTLHVVKGEITNITVIPNREGGLSLSAFKYSSAIVNKSPAKFKKYKLDNNFDCDTRVIAAGKSLSMSADAIHTIGVEQGKSAAWFVYEGKENKNYEAICYSNAPLHERDFSSLYRKMSNSDVIELLHLAGLI